MTFGYFWAISINVMLLFFREAQNISTNFGRDQLFLTLSLISFICFGFKRSKGLTGIVLILSIALLNQWNVNSGNVFYHWIYFSVGMCLFYQSFQQTEQDRKYISRGSYPQRALERRI